MLRIIQNRSAASAKSYYSRADYYGEGQDRAGLWGGRTARQLGLEGRIREADFAALCDNRDPRSGEQLTARHNTDRTVGYDFNWHVPKGVSLAWAVGGDERIAEVFERSVQQTMAEIEAEAKTRVRTGGRQEDRTTGNLVWGQFLHTTARPDEHGDADPHLHMHCFVFNVTHDPKENRYKAVQFRELKRDAPYFEARMHARLAKALKDELGYSIERSGRQWDIAGLPADLKRKFSRRTTEIEALAKQQGITDPDEKAELGAKTRNSKTEAASFKDLQTEWRSRLSDDEARLFDSLTDPSGSGSVPGPQTTAAAVNLALQHCFEREAVVPERQVLTEALRFGLGTVNVFDVQKEACRQGLLTRDIDGRRLATTPEVLADEAAVLNFARSGRHAAAPLNPDWQPTEDWLSDEQTAAIRQLTGSTDRLQLLLGGAGTGKTTMMQQAVAAINAGGHDVFTFAPSADASRKVLRDEGFVTATTVAELLVNERLQQTIAGQVIWIDEASLLGSRQLRRVTDLAGRLNARLILSGDWKRQHGSVDRGGVLGLIDRYTPVTPIQINTIRRQDGEYRDAIASLAEGNILGGFDQLDDLGWVRELPDEDRDRQLARDYADVIEKKQSALVVSPTHFEADHLTQAIRTELKQRGTITGDEHDVAILQPRHLTEAQRRDPAWLEDGDVIVFHQNAKGLRKGTRLIVSGRVPEAITEQAARFSVYRRASLKLATGDRIRLTSGGSTKDGKHRLNNGATFTIRSIAASGDIELSNGWVIDKDFGHLGHGFVTTSHASQGRTVDHVFLAESAESSGAASRQQFYVSASRGRRSARIYTDSIDDLRQMIQKDSTHTTASEVFPSVTDPQVLLERNQRHRQQQEVIRRDGKPRPHTPDTSRRRSREQHLIPELIHER
ncbi:MAG: MobF family relaxase [Planctomycetaceae bacterium]